MDNELIALLDLILKRLIVTLPELAKESGFTRRQLMYRLEKINDLLSQYHLPALEIGPQREITMDQTVRDFLCRLLDSNEVEKQYFLNKKERMDYMFMMLFINQEYISLQHFISALDLSRSTVIADLKELSQMLSDYGIEVAHNRQQGYFLNGNEVDIRSYMMRLVILSLADERNTTVWDKLIDDLYLDTFEYSRLMISELAEKHGIVFVGDRLDEFIYIFIFLKARIINGKAFDFDGHYLPYFEKIKTMKEFAFTKELITYYKNTSAISDNELNYISAWILAVSVGNFDEDTQDGQIIGTLVGNILTRFEYLSGSHYTDSTEIFKQLYCHFRPAYYRLLFKLPIYNPLCHRIQQQYKEYYALVEETMKPFYPLFGGVIPEDELAYLTMHFAAIFSKHAESDEIAKKKALIVCSNGIGSSAILYNQLKEMFPELHFYYPIASANFEDFEEEVDIVFTTQSQPYLTSANIPMIKVNPIMSVQEKYEVISQVYHQLGNPLFRQPNIPTIIDIVRKHAVIADERALENELLLYFSSNRKEEKKQQNGYTLLEMLNKESICLNLEASDWEKAVRISGDMLVNQGFVKQEYVEKIIEINRYKPQFMVIAPHVALPHTRPEFGALRCSMGLTTLKEPIYFGTSENNPVRYIFFLAAQDNRMHLPAMSQLLELLSDPAFYQLLETASTPQEILSYIQEAEQRIYPVEN